MNGLLKKRAQKLRINSTDAEHRLWSLLRSRRLQKYKFRRQHVIEPYIVDFICLSKKLIIELDGGQHADNQDYDKLRSEYLESKGFRVLRFWNNLVFREKEKVIESIIRELEN